jgi:two-component system OmpR family response regulator
VVRPSTGFAGRVEYCLLHPEEVVRRTTLLEKVWDRHFDPESNVVDVHIKKLRRKLREATGEPLLETVRGVGFCLRRDSEVAGSSGAV